VIVVLALLPVSRKYHPLRAVLTLLRFPPVTEAVEVEGNVLKFWVYVVPVRENCAWAEGARVSADPAARRSAMGRRIVVVVWEKVIGVHLGTKPKMRWQELRIGDSEMTAVGGFSSPPLGES
jgi:hypothetical protein